MDFPLQYRSAQSPSTMLLMLLYCCVLLIVYHLYLRYCYAGRLLAKIPGPKPLPVIGHTLEICRPKDKLFGYVRHFPKKYGTIIKLHGFHLRCVQIYDPKDIEVFLSSPRCIEKQLPYTFLRPWLGDGMLLSNGDKWHKRRKLLAPSFHLSVLKQFFQVFVEQTEEFLKQVDVEVGREKTDAMPIIMKATIRIMMEISMGVSVADYGNTAITKYGKALQTMGQSIADRLIRIWMHVGFVFRFSEIFKVQKAALNDLHCFTKQIINERREYRKNNKYAETNDESFGIKNKLAFMDTLLELESAGKIDEAGIREEVDTFMFAGHDTTAAAVNFMIMRIANEPDVQNTIYEELQRVFGDSERTPTMEDLSELKYLECCIKESLRLYPSVPFTARYTREEVVLSGYKVPPHTIIAIHPYDVHRRPELYPDPEKFIPERFLPENIRNRHPYAYIPFSAGPRNCIGQKFAMLEMKTIMSGLLRRFCLEPVTKDEDIHYIGDMILRPSHPIYVRFCRRKNYKITNM